MSKKRLFWQTGDNHHAKISVMEEVTDIEVEFTGPAKPKKKRQRKSRRRIENGVVKNNV